MNCFNTTKIIAEQLWQWVLGIQTYLENICVTITQKILQLVQSWENVCSQVAQQVQQWQQQWQNQCSQVSSQVCKSLPWPLDKLCGWVTSTVCNLVSVLVLVVITVIQTVCSLVSVLILVVATIVSTLCTLVMIIVNSIILVLYIVLVPVLYLICLVVPCSKTMESSVPPDNGWLVTFGLATPPKLSVNNQVSILPDGELACLSMIDAIKLATKTIHLIQLDFEPDFIATFVGTAPQLTLVDAFKQASDRGVKIRFLLNENEAADSIPKLQTAFAGAANIELAGLKISLLKGFGVLHAKGMFIDSSIAFIDGLPFKQGYWDTQSHICHGFATR